MMKKVALSLGAFALLLVSFFGILKHYESGKYVEPSADSLKAKDGETRDFEDDEGVFPVSAMLK